MTERFSSHNILPEKPFFEDNRSTIDALFAQLGSDFPESGAASVITTDEPQPTPEAMAWMWSHFMGRQHGTMEGIDEKIDLSSVDERPYKALIEKLHYDRYGFMDQLPTDPSTHYTASIIQGGLPQEIATRLQAGVGIDPRIGNVDDTIVLAGQRLRWTTQPGERSIEDIYEAVARETGVDIDRLREQSPWIRYEEAKPTIEGDVWSGSYATEYEIGRLTTEAYFHDLIDWKHYDPDYRLDPAPQDTSYDFRGTPMLVPSRTESLATYHLTNGTRVHVLNAAAVQRTQGVPRPNSDSQTREIVSLGIIGSRPETINVAVSAPHIRAGIDTFIRLLQERIDIVKLDIASHAWAKDKELISALGEIPATHKADMRLQALARGEDPDAPDLMSL